jgi:LysR family glycine cleavage system transcriptional activator
VPGRARHREPAGDGTGGDVDLDDLVSAHDRHVGTVAGWAVGNTAGIAAGVDPGKGILLEDMNVALQAAIEGQGVALASLPLVHADLRAGRLVRPFDVDIPVELSFYMVCEAGRERSPELAPFLDWLREEANAMSVVDLEQ